MSEPCPIQARVALDHVATMMQTVSLDGDDRKQLASNRNDSELNERDGRNGSNHRRINEPHQQLQQLIDINDGQYLQR